MAVACYRTCCRSTTFCKRNQMFTHGFYRYYAVANSKTDPGVLAKVKKFVFGESLSPEQLDQNTESYYKLMEDKSPMLYNMEPAEIKERLQTITKKSISMSTQQKWQLADTRDVVIKYKILKDCKEEFGLEVPSHYLKDINCVKDIVKYYCSVRTSLNKTFHSLDVDNLPHNLPDWRKGSKKSEIKF